MGSFPIFCLNLWAELWLPGKRILERDGKIEGFQFDDKQVHCLFPESQKARKRFCVLPITVLRITEASA